MEEQTKRYRVRTPIVGGGLALKCGEIVVRDQLGEHADYLERAGGLEEITAEETREGHSPRGR